MLIELDKDGISVLKALASDTRVSIIKLLLNTPLTVSELAIELGLSKAIISRDIRLLEDSKIIKLQENSEITDSRKKKFILNVDHIEINFPKKYIFLLRKLLVK